jgi:predicted dehydrogenase
MVGYNRRFAPTARKLRRFFSNCPEPLMMHYRVNAGYIPLDHWVHDPKVGGGRVIGEVCHFIDFMIYLAGSAPVNATARALPNRDRYRFDNVEVSLTFANGSVGTVHYFANGDKAWPKENVFVSGGGAIGELDNFRALKIVRNGTKANDKSLLKQDKGFEEEWRLVADAITGGRPAPIPFEQIIVGTRASIRIARAVEAGDFSTIDLS